VSGAPDAYVFDLYGTLLNFASLSGRFRELVADADRLVADWRAKQLLYAFAATAMDRYADFDTLTGLAFDYACGLHGVAADPGRRAGAVAAWSALPAFPDATEALATLRARDARCAVLSNGTPGAIAAALAGAGIAGYFEATLSVDAVRAYKPRPAVYELAVARFATQPGRIVFVSSNGWDATGAAEFGLRVVWCNRSGLPAETFGKPPERTIASLTELLHD
jgi:2-haloacid dehalogenase